MVLQVTQIPFGKYVLNNPLRRCCCYRYYYNNGQQLQQLSRTTQPQYSTIQTAIRNHQQQQQQQNEYSSQQQQQQQQQKYLLSSIAAATALATGWIVTSQPTTIEQNNKNLLFLSSIIRTTKLEESSISTEETRVVENDTTEHNNNNYNKSESTEEDNETTNPTTTVVLNWSGTHAVEVPNHRYYEPTSIPEVEEIVKYCHTNNIPLRPVGSALSPNGIAFNNEGMINMSNIDELVQVDTVNRTVTVQAGARVAQVIGMLQPYNLTLPNLASIAEQQMGGFVQVGAHGTGRTISPVDHYVTAITLVTPGKGTITLSEQDGEVFHLTKVGLGCFGVVVEITMQCIPAHKLVEHTYVLTRYEAIQQLDTLLKQHKHIRYMWIPYTDSVVVVTNDPEDSDIVQTYDMDQYESVSLAEQLKPFTDLLLELNPDATMEGMGFGELRDAVLAYDPLNCSHVRRCNEAEAQFWKNAVGYQIRPSHELLQFDCGGQQWVWEVCFPTGTQEINNGNDIKFMIELLEGIEKEDGSDGIPAHAPIEQRWSASSSSLMSPAHGPTDGLHTWVGIINYLPSDESIMDPITIQRQRTDITNLFKGKYCDLMRTVGIPYGAVSHWAKIELPNSIYKLIDVQVSLSNRYPIHKFNQLRAVFDPKNLLSSPFINSLFGKPQ